ncbi:UNVERIFIED_CONTAM: putative mitochondrial protein [Sesamum indicum]
MDYDNIGNRIWIAWDYNYTDVDIIEVGNQFIHCRATIRALQEYVDITIVYGATEVSDRRELWASLESLDVQCINTPWLVGGDFNAVRDLSENTALLPLPMQGKWYTWHNRSASPRNLWKRLDRMLTNDTWTLQFPSVFYQCLTPRTSDHSLMVVNGDNQQRFGGMFRFDNFLTLSPDFIPSVQSIWQQQIVGVPMFSVTRKLKALKPIFREQRRNKGDLSHNVELARGFLEQAQVLVSLHRQDEHILQLEHCSRLVYTKAAELERIMLQQRAKMEWMKGGDLCSRVFFRKIAQRKTARRILQINDAQGITITEPNAVIHEFISYYQSLLGGDRRQRVMDLRFLRPWARHIITTEEAAPGPNGYSLGFHKNAWPVVGQEITKAVLEFFSTGKLLKQINSTILTVIPKVHSSTSVADFRPISCCNVLYKIIAKLIVQKLSVILDKIISPCQAAFVPGRSIGDNVMLAEELFTGYNQARLPLRCALKVDIRKAYDTVEWDFLLSVLQLFGFLEIFRRLSIADCQPLLSKIDTRINGWEGLALSYAGRVQIIKSVLVAMGVYWASAFILPKGVIKDIEKRLRAFLWRGTGNSGYPKVAWKEICKPKEEGGLGLKDMGTLNRALMCKKLCEVIRCDRTSIWVEWLRHGRLRDDSIWTILENRGPWGWRKMLRLRGWLRSVVEYRIGDGSDFFLWNDPWHHLGPLLDRFSRGPNSLGLNESTMLSSVIYEGHWHWPLITDMECVEITHVLPRIHGGTDRIIWKGSSGKPTTQEFYRAMIPARPKVGWISLLSGSLKIPRHLFILWLAILEKLATTDKPWLSHLGCCFSTCFSTADLVEDASLVFGALYDFSGLIGIGSEMLNGVQERRGKHIINISYRCLLGSCVYHIWRERNLRRFEHEESPPSVVANLIVEDVRQRILSIKLPSSISICALYRLWRIPWPVEGSA